VLVVVQPRTAATTTDERGWPLGYFEKTFGSIDDDSFGRPPQGELPRSVENLRDRPKPGSQGNNGDSPMSIENRRQLENTRTKLQELEQLVTKTEQTPTTDEHVRELTLRSLKKRMNQFKEEIARFEARARQPAPNQ
jgi:hypothetical protein